MDIDVFPNTLDYWGPNAMVFTRQVQIRFTQPIGKDTKLAVSLENPSGNITISVDSGNNRITQRQVVVISIRHNWSGHHVKVAGVFHPLTYEMPDKERESKPGWGVNLSGAFQLEKSKDN